MNKCSFYRRQKMIQARVSISVDPPKLFEVGTFVFCSISSPPYQTLLSYLLIQIHLIILFASFWFFSLSFTQKIHPPDTFIQKRNHSNAWNVAKDFVNRAHWPSTKFSISKNRRINARSAIAALISAPISKRIF